MPAPASPFVSNRLDIVLGRRVQTAGLRPITLHNPQLR